MSSRRRVKPKQHRAEGAELESAAEGVQVAPQASPWPDRSADDLAATTLEAFSAERLDWSSVRELFERQASSNLGRRALQELAPRASLAARAAHGRVAEIMALPDFDDNLHSLSDFRGKRVLLITWASW